jgi:hypothetical protein
VIVRCNQIIDPLGAKVKEHPAISVGEQYVVLTVYASRADTSLRVYSVRPEARDPHPGPPAQWSSEMFEVLSNDIPSNWRAEITETGAIRLEPEPWLRPGFWQDLIDWSPLSEAATIDYERELQVMLAEAGLAPAT